MAEDLLSTINNLQNAAMANCRKRIEEAAAKTRRIVGSDSDSGHPKDPRRKPPCGVTSILKEKHGL
ncbi:MAG TPA: hypothetical protein PKM50_08350 [Methanoregula sp.]|nr:hypothetical protein [Methanoregula sp.]